MALPEFTMRQLLEAGVHFGHQTHRWNPKMGKYIFGARSGVHIIDLAQTVPLLHQALVAVQEVVAGGGRVLFVGTKRQASTPISEAAERAAQYYINARWLGGTLTNWKTISNSIKRLSKLEELLGSDEAMGFTKREQLTLTRERDKLDRALGGIKNMGGTPDMMFVVDTNKEANAIREANRLNIPVVAVLDSNSDPAGVDYPIPGNDDAGRAVSLYCDLISRAAIDGISASQSAQGADLGEMVDPVVEVPEEEAPVVDEVPKAKKAEEAPAKEEKAPEAEKVEDAPAKEEKAPEAKKAPAKKADTETAPAKKAVAKKAPAKKAATKKADTEKAPAKKVVAKKAPAKKAATKKAPAKKAAAKKAPAKKAAAKKAAKK